jgi:hypothetical protein
VPWPKTAPGWLVREVGDDALFSWPFQENRFAPYKLEPVRGTAQDSVVGVMALSTGPRKRVLETLPRKPSEPIAETLQRLFEKLEPRSPLKS